MKPFLRPWAPGIVWADSSPPWDGPPKKREWSDCGPDPRPAAPVVTVKTECRHTIRDPAYCHQARMRHGLTFQELHDRLSPPSQPPQHGRFNCAGDRYLEPCRWSPLRTDREQFIDALKAFGSQMRQGEPAQHARNKLIELFDKQGK